LKRKSGSARKRRHVCRRRVDFPGPKGSRNMTRNLHLGSMFCLSVVLIVSLNPCELEVVCAKEERLRLEEEERFRKEEETCLQKEGGFPRSQGPKGLRHMSRKSSFGV